MILFSSSGFSPAGFSDAARWLRRDAAPAFLGPNPALQPVQSHIPLLDRCFAFGPEGLARGLRACARAQGFHEEVVFARGLRVCIRDQGFYEDSGFHEGSGFPRGVGICTRARGLHVSSGVNPLFAFWGRAALAPARVVAAPASSPAPWQGSPLGAAVGAGVGACRRWAGCRASEARRGCWKVPGAWQAAAALAEPRTHRRVCSTTQN